MLDVFVLEDRQSDLVDRLLLPLNRSRRRKLSGIGIGVLVRRKGVLDGLEKARRKDEGKRGQCVELTSAISSLLPMILHLKADDGIQTPVALCWEKEERRGSNSARG